MYIEIHDVTKQFASAVGDWIVIVILDRLVLQ